MARGSAGSETPTVFFSHWLPVIAYISIIFVLSAQPHLQPPLHFLNSDKLMHLCEYGGLGLLLGRAVRRSRPGRTAMWAALATLAVGALIAAGDENFQRLIPGRSCDLFDWLADCTGLTLAQIVYVAFARDAES